MNVQVHISSLLVTAKPVFVARVVDRITAMPIAEVAHSDRLGKIIVTLETADESAIVQALTGFQLFGGVVGAALVYHHTETEALANSPALSSDKKGNAHV